MKKINEDVQITDPALAQQYANGQTQLLNKDRQINALQKQINNIEQSKNDIAKKMAEIEKKAAQSQPDEVQQNLDQQQVAAEAAVQATQAAQVGESLLINELDSHKDHLVEEYDRITDELVTLKNLPVSNQRPNHDATVRNLTKIAEEIEDKLFPGATPKDGEDNWDSNGYRVSEAEEERYTGQQVRGKGGMMYQDGKAIGWETTDYTKSEAPISDAQMKKSDKNQEQMRDISYEIDALEDNIQYIEDELNSLTDSPDGQEECDAEILDRYGWDVLDYFNGGNKNVAELQQMGVGNPKDVIQMYDFYHPEESELEKQRIPLRKQKEKYKKEISKLQKKHDKIEDKESNIWADKYKSKKRFTSVHGKEQQRKSAPNVYDNVNPLSIENFYDLSEAYVDDAITFNNTDEYDSEKYLFYTKITDGHNEFIAKIFKMSPDGDWFGIIKDGGDSKSFENISYDPSYDEEQIIEYLRETYDEVEIIDMNEFNNYLEGTEKPDTSDWTVKDVEESSGPTMQM